MRDLTFIFVHGLSGWGSYDKRNRYLPYWGLRSGDLISFLRKEGFDCYAASVDPFGSAWDRACELYAQIAGSRTDYGEAHSKEFRHERFGRDFSSCPLIERWDEDTRLVLIGHSFGGATVRLLSELLANGDEKEKNSGAEDISPLFQGGMKERVFSIVALASPMNGTTAYDMYEDESFDIKSIKVPLISRFFGHMTSVGTEPKFDGRDRRDYADYDMHIDNAMKLNERMKPIPSVYYFSVPCSKSILQKDGTYKPDKKGMEPHFIKASILIGQYTGKTKGGFEVDKKWLENDGLVNTFSAKAPIGAPAKDFDKDCIEPGIWNILPVFNGDHMSLQGGLLKKTKSSFMFLDLMKVLQALYS